jgi:hypothetical protein
LKELANYLKNIVEKFRILVFCRFCIPNISVSSFVHGHHSNTKHENKNKYNMNFVLQLENTCSKTAHQHQQNLFYSKKRWFNVETAHMSIPRLDMSIVK